LRALYEVAGIKKIGTYEIGYMIGPRINAAGRIDSALIGLRLLCTKDITKAREWAKQLDDINKERQKMAEESTQHAFQNAKITEKIIVIEHEAYHSGIIGLIAGKLTEKYYLPSIVISKGEKMSKASARSISGFNIIEAIKTHDKLLVNAGGHPAAAGFTIKTSEISNFKLLITKYANEKITDDMLEKTLKIDCELDLKDINMDFYNSLAQFAPYGMGSPEPVFASGAIIQDLRTVGDGKHLKLVIASKAKQSSFDAIAFNLGHMAGQLKVGQKIKLAYALDLNTFNGKTNLQLKVKDIIKQ
ncbi:MAG: DHHA1 domain-containing protein, partial [Patescibacteria group bacterium]